MILSPNFGGKPPKTVMPFPWDGESEAQKIKRLLELPQHKNYKFKPHGEKGDD